MTPYDFTKTNAPSVEGAFKTEYQHGNYDDVLNKYHDPATQYAFKVLNGDILASQMIKLNSFRHLQDLRRITEDDDFPYHYDLKKCLLVLNFAKLVPDVSVGKPLPLMPWQQMILCLSQGWRDEHDQKRYDRVILSIARTNGKTYLSNILNTYAFLMEARNLYNQDLIYAAPISKQSKKGFSYLKTTFDKLKNINKFKRLFEHERIDVLDEMVINRKRQNKLMQLTFNSAKFDEYHALFAVADEAASNSMIARIRESIGQITSGMVQTDNHQLWQISTAYPDATSYFYQDEQMMRESMMHDDDRSLDNYLCMVYEQDSTEELKQPQTWSKSNPILDLPAKHEKMLNSLINERDTKESNGSVYEFENKSLNMWLQTKVNTYLQLDEINNAIVNEPPFKIDGHEVYIGFDKSNLSDDTALAFIYPYLDDNQVPQFFIQQHSWIPLAKAHNQVEIKEKQDGIAYRKAEINGYCDIAKNRFGYIDDEAIFEWLMEYIEDHDLKVQYFCYDKWSASRFIAWIEQKTNLATMPVQQAIKTLNEPTVEFRKQMLLGNVHYLNDDIIQYSLKNAVLYGNAGGVKVDKDLATTKIDCVDAIIDAFYMAMYHFDDVDFHKPQKTVFDGWSDEQIDDYFKNNCSF